MNTLTKITVTIKECAKRKPHNAQVGVGALLFVAFFI
jgi:hypothetical protein